MAKRLLPKAYVRLKYPKHLLVDFPVRRHVIGYVAYSDPHEGYYWASNEQDEK